jgi:very-short-patch-repair endonuclease
MQRDKKLIYTNFHFPFDPGLKYRARDMRNNSTRGEIKFWCELLRHKKSGYQFYRQKVLLHYIVDFYCCKLKLVIEIDGSSHDDKKDYDQKRDKDLQELGLKIIRYNDLMVLNNFQIIEDDFKQQLVIRANELGLK